MGMDDVSALAVGGAAGAAGGVGAEGAAVGAGGATCRAIDFPAFVAGDVAADVVVCGGGPTGMAAAWAASRCGASVVLMERADYLGGVLPQCVHDGFGLYAEGESLTGPRYAKLLEGRLAQTDAAVALETSVLGFARNDAGEVLVSCVGPRFGGPATVRARSVVVATGCRERTRGQLRVPGTRPAGVMTAGCAQYMMNIRNQKPGTSAVVLGSGDIGLIMARRMKLEGIDVRMVLGQEATGLYRNHVQCIREMGIPIRYGWTVLSVHGRGRLKGVMVAPMAPDGSVDRARREYVRCNVLLVAAGLIPELDFDGLDTFDLQAEGPLFLAGNASHIHDLVDGAVSEGVAAGSRAARYAAADASGDAAAGSPSAPFAVPADVARAAGMSVPEGMHSDVAGRAGARDVLESGVISELCSGCPAGCLVQVKMEGSRVVSVEGGTCDKSVQVVTDMLENPKRLFTGTVRCNDGAGGRLLPVVSSAPVPIESLFAIARACRRIAVGAPVAVDDVVAANVCGLGVDLLATSDVSQVGA